MPDDPAFYYRAEYYCATAGVYRSRPHRRRHRFTHCMELVIGGNLLNQPFAVILKQDKIAGYNRAITTVKKSPARRFCCQSNCGLSFSFATVFTAGSAFIRRERANARILPIAHHQRFVTDKQIVQFVFIGL